MFVPKRIRIARLVVAAELPVLLAIAPFLLFPTPRRLLVLLVVPPLWICARVATGRVVPSTPLNLSLWLLLIMVAVSLWATFDIVLSLGKVCGVVLGALLFWAVARWMVTPARLKAGIAVFVVAGAALAVIALLGTQWQNKFPVFVPLIAMLPRMIRGIPGADEGFNPNAAAGCLVLFVPLQLVLVFAGASPWLESARRSSRVRGAFVVAQLALLFLTAGTIVLLQSRGAWFGLVAAGVAFLIWRARWTRLLALVGAGVATLALGPTIISRLVVDGPAVGLEGMADRVEIWSRALYGFHDFALTGMGMNTFRKVMPVFYPTVLVSPARDVPHAHNNLLQAGLDLGLPGLIAYASIWLLVGSLLVMTYRRSASPALRAVAGGLGAGLIAHFVFGLTDAIPLGAKVGLLFWLAIALTVALHHVALVHGPSVQRDGHGALEPSRSPTGAGREAVHDALRDHPVNLRSAVSGPRLVEQGSRGR